MGKDQWKAPSSGARGLLASSAKFGESGSDTPRERTLQRASGMSNDEQIARPVGQTPFELSPSDDAASDLLNNGVVFGTQGRVSEQSMKLVLRPVLE